MKIQAAHGPKVNWTPEEDAVLAEVMLESIRSNEPIGKAYEKAGKILNRKPGGCTFRWRSVVCKHYKNEIQTVSKLKENAVTSKHQNMKEKVNKQLGLDIEELSFSESEIIKTSKEEIERVISLDSIMNDIKSLVSNDVEINDLKHQLELSNVANEKLTNENNELREKLSNFETKFQEMMSFFK